MRVLIITGGAIDHAFAVDYMKHHTFDRIIAADRGLHFCKVAGILPDVILGDFDSVQNAELNYYQENYRERIWKYPARKNATDTELALNLALEYGSKKITILGATGTRLDHVLGNIQLLKRALSQGAVCKLVDSHNCIRLIDGRLILHKEKQFGDYISLIPFSPMVEGLTLEGFEYPLDHFNLASGNGRGISNRIQDDTAYIAFSKGFLLVVESKD